MNKIRFFDGGMGTMLQAAGLLGPGALPEPLNLTHPEEIAAIHQAYADAGAEFISTNTFGANGLKFDNVEELVQAATALVRRTGKKVVLDIGPLGKLLQPMGELAFDDAYDLFARTILMDEKGRLLTGADIETAVTMLEGLGVDALGFNCSMGPDQMLPLVAQLRELTCLPIIVNPNAGLPESVNGETVYNVDPEAFAEKMEAIAKLGVSYLGGCCGTTPAHIAKMIQRVKDIPAVVHTPAPRTLVSSYSQTVELGKKPVIVGERINPTGKKLMKAALREKDINYLIKEGIAQKDKGAHILDVNVGLPEIDEPAMMQQALFALQGVLDLPLQIDTSDVEAMEVGLRHYNGKAMLNSVNGKQESMHAVFP